MGEARNEMPERSNLGISGETLLRVRRKQTELAPLFNFSAPSQDRLVNMALDCLDKYGVIADQPQEPAHA